MSKSKEFVLSVYPSAVIEMAKHRTSMPWSVIAATEGEILAFGYSTERSAWIAAARKIKAQQQAETNKIVARIQDGSVVFVCVSGAGEPTPEAALYALKRKCESDAAVAMRLVARLKDELERAEQRAADAQDALTVALPAIAAARADLNK